MAEDGDFRIAGAFTEIYLKDSTDADWAKIKAKLEKNKGVKIGVTLGEADTKPLRTKAQKELDANPLRVPTRTPDPVTVPTKATDPFDAAWRAKINADIRSTAKQAIQIPMEPATADFRAKVASDLAEAEAMARKPIPVDVDADDWRATIQAALTRIRTQVESANAAEVKVAVAPDSLAKVKSDTEKASKGAGQSGGSLMAAALSAGVLAGGPLVSGAIVGIGATGLTALGVALEKGRPAIKSRWDQLSTDAKSSASGAAEAMVTPIAGALDQIDNLVIAQQPALRSLFSSAASDIEPLTSGLVDLAKNALPGLDSAMHNSVPIAQGLGQVERDIGTAISSVSGAVATSSGQMGSDLNQVGATAKAAGAGIGTLINVSTGLAAGALPVLNAALNATDTELTGVHTVLGPLEPLIGGVAVAGVAGWKLLPPVMGAASTASKAVSGGILNVAASLENAAPKMSNMAASTAGVVESLGPVGLMAAAGGALIAVAALGKAQQQEAQVSRDQASAALQVAHAIEATGGAVTAQTRAQTASTLQGDSWVQAMTSQGVSLRDITDAALGVPGALQKVQHQVDDLGGASSTADNILKGVSGGLLSNGDAANKAKDGLGVLDGVSVQATKDNKDLAAASKSTTSALAEQGSQAATTQSVLNSYGNAVAKQASTAQAATSGIKSMTDATVSANTTFFQDQQGFAQLDAAVASASQARIQASQGIAAASNGIRQASQGVASALHSEGQATEAVGTARAGVVTAQRAVTAAQTSYTQSLAAERTAQAALSAARKQAVVDLQALQRQVTDQGDTEAEAQVRLLDATNAVINAGLSGKTLASLGPLTTGNEANFQLLLAEQEAQHNLNDTTIQSQQLAAQNAAQQKAGVAGAAGVVSATQAVTQAQQQDKAAAQSLADSKAAVLKSSAAVKDAQYQEQQAHLATENAQYAEKQASDQLTAAKAASRTATAALQVAKDADSRSTDINTAAGAANFTKIEDLYEANISAGMSVADATTATINQGHSMHITAGNVKEVIDRITGLNGSTARFGVIGQPSVDLSQLINMAAKQGLDPHQLGFSSQQIGNARASGSGIFPTHAEGGLLGGTGTGTSDSNLIRASKGEFMVRESETRKHLPLLHAINDGKVPGFASGGVIGGDGASLIASNLMLGEVGGMVQAARDAFGMVGVKGLPALPTKNPPEPTFSGNAAAGSGLRGSRADNEALVERIWSSMFGWTGNEWAATVPLIMQESGFNNTAQNPTSTAYGMFQFLDSTWGGYGIAKTSDPTQQSIAGGRYIEGRYRDPIGALAHERAYNWYDNGGYMLGNPGINLTKKPEMVLDPGMTNTLDTINTAVQSGGRTSTSGRSVNITNYITQQPRENGSALASRVSAENAWNLMTMAGG